MAVKTSDSLEQVYEQYKAAAARTKRYAQNAIDKLAAGPVKADDILDLYESAQSMKATLDAAVATPGLVDFAKTYESDPLYDASVENATLSAAIASMTAWIETGIPNSNGWLLVSQFVSGTVVPREFTTLQTTGLRTALQAIVDAVE